MADFKWLPSPEAKRLAKAAEAQAWAHFLPKYPNADKSEFVAQTDFDDDHKATAEIYFKEGPGSLKSVFGSDSRYWLEPMKKAVGKAHNPKPSQTLASGGSATENGGFPPALNPTSRVPKTIPAVPFFSVSPPIDR